MALPLTKLPVLITVTVCTGLLLYGPIPQPDHYHAFADSRILMGIPHAANVLSNLGFALLAAWGGLKLYPHRRHPAIAAGWPGYLLFLVGLLLTACGSSFYHLAPDNFRLLWDRLPIALACAGLFAAVRAETHAPAHGKRDTFWLAMFAVASVGWWYASARLGWEDLRPYLLLQILPILLLPLWQALYASPHADRRMFAVALLCYIAAKAAEAYDQALLGTLVWLSGHTLKHLLATLAGGILIMRLVKRVEQPCAILAARAGKAANIANASTQPAQPEAMSGPRHP